MRNRKVWPAALLCAAGLAACGRDGAAPQEEVQVVKTYVAGAGDSQPGASYSGQVRARHESKLAFQVGGRLAARLVDVGATVRPGQPLLRLDPQDVALNAAAAAAGAEAAYRQLEQRRVDLARSEQLFSQGFIAQAELDRDRLAVQTAQAQWQEASARSGVAGHQHGYATLYADHAGVVTAINADVGQVLGAGQVALTVAQDGEREVVVSVPESRVDELRGARGMTAATWAAPGKRYPATLRELAPDADSVTRTYQARLSLQGAGPEVLLGMTASIALPGEAAAGGAPAVPLAAIDPRGGQPAIWLVDPKTMRAAPRLVQLGAAQDGMVVVAQGLRSGEQVVSAGVNLLHANQRVRLAQAVEVRP